DRYPSLAHPGCATYVPLHAVPRGSPVGIHGRHIPRWTVSVAAVSDATNVLLSSGSQVRVLPGAPARSSRFSGGLVHVWAWAVFAFGSGILWDWLLRCAGAAWPRRTRSWPSSRHWHQPPL